MTARIDISSAEENLPAHVADMKEPCLLEIEQRPVRTLGDKC